MNFFAKLGRQDGQGEVRIKDWRGLIAIISRNKPTPGSLQFMLKVAYENQLHSGQNLVDREQSSKVIEELLRKQ